MSVKVAINGFGEFEDLSKGQASRDDVEFAAVNDITDTKTLAHSLKYDSVHGTIDADVKAKYNALVVNGKEIKTYAIREPESLPWKDLGVDVALRARKKSRFGRGQKTPDKPAQRKLLFQRRQKGPMLPLCSG